MQNNAFISFNHYPSLVMRIPEITVVQGKQTNSTNDYCTGLLYKSNNNVIIVLPRALSIEFAFIAQSTYVMQSTKQPLLVCLLFGTDKWALAEGFIKRTVAYDEHQSKPK